jgi:hypothetical protein
MMGRCTWEDCASPATFTELNKSGQPWAKLCIAHHNQMETTIAAGKAPAIMSVWIKAQGGAKAAAARIV